MDDIYMTKYEKARVIGQRAEQISRGAPPNVDYTGLYDAMQIAEKELKEGKLCLKICRTFPNGTVRTYKVSEMKYD